MTKKKTSKFLSLKSNFCCLFVDGMTPLCFFLYCVGTLETIVALLSLAEPSLAIAAGCRVSTHALAALQVLGGTVLVLGAFRADDLMLHWLGSLVFGLHIMLAYSLGTFEVRRPPGFSALASCLFCFLSLSTSSS